MSTITGAAIVNVAPFEFSMKMVARTKGELKLTVIDLMRDYRFIDEIVQSEPCAVDVSGLVLMEVRVVLDEDTDYMQMCQLRADLNSRPGV